MNGQRTLTGHGLGFERRCWGWGTHPADFMFVGISAGRLGALITQIPFTKDASGRLLQRCLYRLGFSKSEEHSTIPEYQNCYVTNFVKGRCLTDSGLNRLPTRAEFEFWWPSIKKEVSEVHPKLILALGKIVYDELSIYLFPSADKAILKQLKHPRYYQAHGALSNQKAFEKMVEEYLKVIKEFLPKTADKEDG